MPSPVTSKDITMTVAARATAATAHRHPGASGGGRDTQYAGPADIAAVWRNQDRATAPRDQDGSLSYLYSHRIDCAYCWEETPAAAGG